MPQNFVALWPALAAVLLGCGASSEAPHPPPHEGTGAYGKADGFYSELTGALSNDAADRPLYTSCEELPARSLEEMAEEMGLDASQAVAELHEQLRVVAFGRVLTLLGALKFMRAGDAYAPIALPPAYASLPTFADYFLATERLNTTLEFQRHALVRRWSDERRGGDVLAQMRVLEEEIARLEHERRRLDWQVMGLETRRLRTEELDRMLVVHRRVLEGMDPDRLERRRRYQGQLKAAAFEIEVLRGVERLSPTTASLTLWPSDLEPGETVDAARRLAELEAAFPILSADGGIVFDRGELAPRLFPLLSPGQSAAVWARPLIDHGLDAARAYLAGTLRLELERLRASAPDPDVQDLVDSELDDWVRTLEGELETLPKRDPEELMGYVDLVDRAIAGATARQQLLWLRWWCDSEGRHSLLETGKTVFYLGASAIAIGATLLGQVEIAVPLSVFLTTAAVGDAIGAALKASRLGHARELFWVSHDAYTEAERAAVLAAVLAAGGVAAEAASATRLLKGWRNFQSMKHRLGRMAAEYEGARRTVDELIAELEVARASGRPVAELERQLGSAIRAAETSGDVARIANRTRGGLVAAEDALGRIEIASLMERFPTEAEALAFFEVVSRNEATWSVLARKGYRDWLRAVRDARTRGGDLRLPPACR